jgi:hypothetical protein
MRGSRRGVGTRGGENSLGPYGVLSVPKSRIGTLLIMASVLSAFGSSCNQSGGGITNALQ